MKKILVVFLLWASSNMLFANEEEKSGFLTTQWCAQKGLFIDCPMETVFCGYEGCHKKMKTFNTNIQGKIVLMVHDEGQYYTTEFNKNIKIGEILEKAINKNEVTLLGKIDGNHIIVNEFEAPPPPKKSFFKGCL